MSENNQLLPEPQVFEVDVACVSGEIKHFSYTAHTQEELLQFVKKLTEFCENN